VADRITPEIIRGRPHRLGLGRGEALCITGPGGAGGLEGCSAYLGAFVGDWPDWHRPGSALPDGSFALLRSDGATTELCSDYAGSRTLWYALTERAFFASTSQRAIVCLLQGLDLNRSAFAWFLSSGSLGPTDAWDKRIHRLPRAARLTLDRATWTLGQHTTPVVFQNRDMSRGEAMEGLGALVGRAIRECRVQSPGWILPLSGGLDSRMLLGVLHETGFRPRTVTWGMAASRTQRGNDAFIAQQLARHYGLTNDYLLTERSDAPPAQVVDAFLSAHGGTTDALFPYLDGLRLWARFANEGVGGIIRGDEGFGTLPRPELHHRYAQEMVLLSELVGEEVAEAVADGRQVLPDDLMRRPEESVQTYGDRLVHTCFIPLNLGALTDVKTPFVDIANPMLAGSVLEFVRQMPDRLRARRNVYESLTRAVSPPIPFAFLAADDARNGFLHTNAYMAWMAEELAGDRMERLLPPGFRASLAESLPVEPSLGSSHSSRALLKRLIPTPVVAALRSMMRPVGPTRRLMAFRCALTSRLLNMLEQDAAHLGLEDPDGSRELTQAHRP
jgi:hypothetical protein